MVLEKKVNARWGRKMNFWCIGFYSPCHCRLRDSDPSITADPLAHTHYHSFGLLTQSHSVSAPLHTPIGAAEELPTKHDIGQLSASINYWQSGVGWKICVWRRKDACKLQVPLSLLRLQCFSPADTVASEFTRTSSGLHRQASATARKCSAISILPACFCLSVVMTKAEGFLSWEMIFFLVNPLAGF